MEEKHEVGNRASVVDLDKIRKLREAPDTRRKEALKKATETKRKQKEVEEIFKQAFRDAFKAEYEMRKSGWRSYKHPSGKVKHRRINSDRVRLYEMYRKVVEKYNSDDMLFRSYLSYAFKISSERDYVRTPIQVFGFVLSEKVFEGFFFEKKKDSFSATQRNATVTHMEERHARLFEK